MLSDILMPTQLERSANKRITDDLLCARFLWLCEFHKMNRFVPSYTVIGAGWGGLTRAAVGRSLDLMEGRGLLQRIRGAGRPQVVLAGCQEGVGDGG